ncbi:MAG: hypothetical protein ACYTHM_20905 [Planctomycetota bacterium]|jgi:hypothetical protein
MKRQLLRCKKSRGWLPNEYLTEIVGFCDKGFFRITREFTFPCTYTPHGNLLIDAIENLGIEESEYDLTMIRCGNCGGEVEFTEVDPDNILDRIRSKEVDMNVALHEKTRRREKEGKKPEGQGKG